MSYHEPVLAKESIEALNIRADGLYVDTTFGGGGHSRLILNELGEKGRLYAFDQDDDSLQNLIEDERFVFNHHNFRYLKPDVLVRFGFGIVKGPMLDLPTHGVWGFHHGDEEKFRGGPPGFWEIMHDDPVTGAVLQRLTEKLDAGRIRDPDLPRVRRGRRLRR